MIKTYKFGGLRWKLEDGSFSRENTPDSVMMQFREYGRAYNAMIEIERKRREEFRAYRRQVCPEFEQAEIEAKQADELVASLYDEAKALSSRATLAAAAGEKPKKGKRVPMPDELVARLDSAKAARSSAFARLKSLREEIKTSGVLEAFQKSSDEKLKANKASVRKTSPAYWPTMELATEAADKAVQTSKTDPEFQSFRGEGRIGARSAGSPFAVNQLFDGSSTLIQLESPVPKTGGRRRARSSGRIRIGSDESRKPIWAEFSVTLHRDLPKGGKIALAYIKRERVASHWEHSLYIVIDEPAPAETTAIGTLAIDLNMRLSAPGENREIQVGVSFDGEAPSGEQVRRLILPANVVGQMEHAEGVHEIRSRKFNAFLVEFAPLVVEFISSGKPAPEWFTEAAKFMGRWKGPQRLADLVSRWRSARFDGDDQLFALADRWRKGSGVAGGHDHGDRHLQDYAFFDRAKAEARRQDLYHVWAARIFAKYKTVIIAGWDRAAMAERPIVKSAGDIPDAVRSIRFKVAHSEFVKALADRARHHGAHLIEAEELPISTEDLGGVGGLACSRCGGNELRHDKEKGEVFCGALACVGEPPLSRDELQARALWRDRGRYEDQHSIDLFNSAEKAEARKAVKAKRLAGAVAAKAAKRASRERTTETAGI